jgi:hypothetical protein
MTRETMVRADDDDKTMTREMMMTMTPEMARETTIKRRQ